MTTSSSSSAARITVFGPISIILVSLTALALIGGLRQAALSRRRGTHAHLDPSVH